LYIEEGNSIAVSGFVRILILFLIAKNQSFGAAKSKKSCSGNMKELLKVEQKIGKDL